MISFLDSVAVAPSSTTDDLPPRPSSILPKRVITVFGTESSGSTFLATVLGIASGSFPKNGTYVQLPSDRFNNTGRLIVERTVAKRARSPDGHTEIQHLSLPWGSWGTKKRNCDLAHRTTTVEAFVPAPCFRFDYESTWKHRLEMKAPAGCREEAHISSRSDRYNDTKTWTCGTNNCGRDENEGYTLYPKRFFVNISSHLDWYLQRDVDVTAVLSLRDLTISHGGKLKTHCKNDTISLQEEEKARSIMDESLRKYGSRRMQDNSNEERVMTVSYEALMSLRESYLFDIYKRLGINSTFIPEFIDGNRKYILQR